MFEGSMYLFVFFWTPALKAAQTTKADLPYGTIFASFMAAMTASSLVFNLAMSPQHRLLSYTQLLTGVMAIANLCFYSLARQPRSEQSTFWIFCVFEACVGIYWPCAGYLKGKLVDDGVRAQVYGLLRIPLNVFVVVSLLLTSDGDSYGKVFQVCSVLLLASSGALWATSLGGQTVL
jgi:MFS transporter, MFS domain-containing protein family, molybdate-anion transporter